MSKFFSLSNIDVNYEITLIEKIIPIFILIVLIITLYINRDKVRNNKLLDKKIRYYCGIISLIFLSIYYILEWCSNGITVFNLPLHICFISNILCIILCFNKNKKIFNFVVFTGILGGLSSLLAPELDLSFKYFRYYQFMICHISIIIIPIYFMFFVVFTGILGGLSSLLAPELDLSFKYFRYYQFMICHISIIIIPIYFMFIYKYSITIKDTLKVIFITEILGLSLGVFNEIYNTNYMFVSFTSNEAAKGSILSYVGDTLKVIFITEILGLSLGVFNEIYNTNYMFVSFTSNEAAKGSILSYVGEGYFYFINLQILFLIIMLLWYFILKYSYKLMK